MLSGLTENNISKGNLDKKLLDDDNEDSMIMKKIEENQKKQAQSEVEKTYIIDNIDEELA